jgi:hypothetical protein
VPRSLNLTINPCIYWGPDRISGQTIFSIYFQPDEELVMGGIFSIYNATLINNLMRIDSKETFDATFTKVMGSIREVVKKIQHKVSIITVEQGRYLTVIQTKKSV